MMITDDRRERLVAYYSWDHNQDGKSAGEVSTERVLSPPAVEVEAGILFGRSDSSEAQLKQPCCG